MGKVIIIGGGAAGMFAAVTAARDGHKVTLLEKNEKLGKKLFLTGKGRCNLTNSCGMEMLQLNTVKNGRFMYSAFDAMPPEELMEYFRQMGLKLKIERGNRVFPVSDHSSDVIKTLERELRRLNVEVLLNTKATRIIAEEGHFNGITIENGRKLGADACIIATGGLSYPSTGSTGDGFRFAKLLGHEVTELSPSLVPIYLKDEYVKELQGLSLKNVRLHVYLKKGSREKEIYEGFGEMLFTHFGISGPLALSASSYIAQYAGGAAEGVRISIDMKPAMTEEQLEARIIRDFEERRNKLFANALDVLLPARLTAVAVALTGIDVTKKVHSVTREERHKINVLLKNFPCTVERLGSFAEAVITKGGVNVKEVSPSTMESKLVKGVYFAGEILDVDAMTGGFNLQIAWSTAYAAAKHINQE